MSARSEPRSASVHATGPQAHSEDASVWPAVLAVALVVGVVGLTVAPAVALLALALALIGVIGVTREVTRAHAGRRAPHLALALALTIPVIVITISILRAFVAHGLLAPGGWPDEARDLNSPSATAVALLTLASAGAAGWGARGAASGNARRVTAGVAGALALGAGALVARAVEWRTRASAGFGIADGPAGSAYYALTGFHALAAAAALAMLGLAAWRARRARARGDASADAGLVTAAAAFWVVVAVTWLVAYAIVYLKLIVIERAPLM